MNKNENQVKWKLPAQILPISYIILICIGYTEKSLFYDKFGIDIAPYLNFEEYLFIFLPIGSALIGVVILLTVYLSGIIGVNFALSEKPNGFFNRLIINPEYKIENHYSDHKKTNKIRLILIYILMGFVILIPIAILLYFGINKLVLENNAYKINKNILIASLLWSLIMLILIFSRIPKKENTKSIFLIYAFFMSLIVPIFINSKILHANNILQGKSSLNVSFMLNKKKISTNDSIMFIGQTKEYLFMRNINSGNNIIYRKEEISKMEISK
ncbi:hypothetical protein ACIVBQ_003047 [Tenacibaculum discolor]